MSDLQWSRDDPTTAQRSPAISATRPSISLTTPDCTFDQRARLRRRHGGTRRGMAVGDRGSYCHRPQHGRPSGAQRLPYRRDGGHLWRTKLRKLVFLGTPIMGAPSSASAIGLTRSSARRPMRRPSRGSGRSAAQALPICGTEALWTRIGEGDRLALAADERRVVPCRRKSHARDRRHDAPLGRRP